ncbi:hypothetical protein [Cecembia calidifontis]|uniref:hypothetical protein n=1 Tax=Cecembia calidifontis TaxID=1187080 RepID=UPI0013EEA011|nr:hypothetical protein [Cecembia calidifontis]
MKNTDKDYGILNGLRSGKKSLNGMALPAGAVEKRKGFMYTTDNTIETRKPVNGKNPGIMRKSI